MRGHAPRRAFARQLQRPRVVDLQADSPTAAGIGFVLPALIVICEVLFLQMVEAVSEPLSRP